MAIVTTLEGQIYYAKLEVAEPLPAFDRVSGFEDLAGLFTPEGGKHISRMECSEARLLFDQVAGRRGAALDIGTRHGGSAVLLAAAMPDARVLSIDIKPEIPDPLFEALAGTDLEARIEFRRQSSRIAIPNQCFSVIVFDGDHTASGVRADIEAHWSALSDGGLAVFHDVSIPALVSPSQQSGRALNKFQREITPIVRSLLEREAAMFIAGVGDLVVLAKRAELSLSADPSAAHASPNMPSTRRELEKKETTSMTMPVLKVDPLKWSAEAQEGELAFHKRPNFRTDAEKFSEANARLFKSFGYRENQFSEKTVVDLGAGSKLRAKFFTGAHIVAIEPIADQFIKEVPWCDLTDAQEIYSLPAEQLIDDLVGRVDFLFSINVLDHCYDFEEIVGHIKRYLRVGGAACLSFDCHSKVDKLHPLVINEKVATQIFFDSGFQINTFRRTSSYHRSIADYAVTYFLSKPE